jgi:hypothetical protein
MGCRLIAPSQIVMFDSVTGWAFGPVFESTLDGEEWLEWFASGRAREVCDNVLSFPNGLRATGGPGEDPREYSYQTLRQLHRVWVEERGGEEA